MALDVATLREVFRNLQQFRAIYESHGVDTITAPGGEDICLFDIEYLYKQLHRLPLRQRQAIELCLVQNIKETEVAVMMGVSPTNPVASYATSGLQKLLVLIYTGELPKFYESHQKEGAGV